jgi:hypothetical protein
VDGLPCCFNLENRIGFFEQEGGHVHAIAMETRLLYFSTGEEQGGSQRGVSLRGKLGKGLGFSRMAWAGFEQRERRAEEKALRA